MAVQNNAIRTNHIEERIDKTQKNSRCRLCGNRDETINHIISEFSKLAQKEHKSIDTTRWARRSIGNCARNFNLTIRTNGICPTQNLSWRMRHKLLWDFEMNKNRLISARRSDLVIIIEKKK